MGSLMSKKISGKRTLYGLLVTEIAKNAVKNDPLVLTSEGRFADRNQIDPARILHKGCFFSHASLSAFENACFVLWALEIVEPVDLVEGRWKIFEHPETRIFPAYFQLRYDLHAIANLAANEASRVFPSLDYVLRTYLEVVEQALFFAVELNARLKNDEKLNSIRELVDLVASALPPGYEGAQAELPVAIERSAPRVAELLETIGYAVRKGGRLTWTKAAAPVLGGNWGDLQGGQVRIVEGRPRLLQ